MGALTVDGDKDGWPGPGAVLTQVGRTQVVWLGRDRGGALVRIIPPYSIYEWSEGKQRDFPSATLLLPVTTWPPSSCVERIVLCRLPYKHFFLGSRRPVSILGSLYGRICLGLHPDRVVAKLCGRSALPEIRTLATLHHAEHVLTRGHHERNDNQYYDSMGLSVGGAP
jgi:hypothetical protein